MAIEQGEVVGFLGHNGAGKTTTVRLLNGVLTPTGGSVRIFDLDPVVDGARVRARTGVLTETPALDDRMTARDTLRFFANVYGVPRTKVNERVDELLAAFDLSARAGDKVGGFSKGMRQRMALARTLIHSPEIIFLDEPTSGLDPVAIREVHQLILGLRDQGRTVFLATHNLNEAERLCDRVAVLARGKALAMGTTHELAQQLKYGHRLLVAVDPAQAATAAQVAALAPHVTQVEVVTAHNGGTDTCLLVHGAGREQTPQLLQELVQAGIAVYRVEPDEPSLEDVYFALEHE
jgi:ABC-2 type transport system ATP-binding protein